MCRVEPSLLAAELPGLKIGQEAVEWYQQELDRYSELAGRAGREADDRTPDTGRTSGAEGAGQQAELLARFSEPFLLNSRSDGVPGQVVNRMGAP
jgi:hypothetical protein